MLHKPMFACFFRDRTFQSKCWRQNWGLQGAQGLKGTQGDPKGSRGKKYEKDRQKKGMEKFLDLTQKTSFGPWAQAENVVNINSLDFYEYGFCKTRFRPKNISDGST